MIQRRTGRMMVAVRQAAKNCPELVVSRQAAIKVTIYMEVSRNTQSNAAIRFGFFFFIKSILLLYTVS